MTVKNISDDDMDKIEEAASKDHRTKASFARHYLVESAKEVLNET